MNDLKEKAPEAARAEEKWWRKGRPVAPRLARPREGQPCPKCALGDLTFDSLFRLHCPVCGYTADCGAFT